MLRFAEHQHHEQLQLGDKALAEERSFYAMYSQAYMTCVLALRTTDDLLAALGSTAHNAVDSRFIDPVTLISGWGISITQLADRVVLNRWARAVTVLLTLHEKGIASPNPGKD
ncbi:hypothetical protein H4R33_000419 [Dimargaris cristalligena]|nr:hypothetical protein H4R33_000419 [Dimargaris cristalligena]